MILRPCGEYVSHREYHTYSTYCLAFSFSSYQICMQRVTDGVLCRVRSKIVETKVSTLELKVEKYLTIFIFWMLNKENEVNICQNDY